MKKVLFALSIILIAFAIHSCHDKQYPYAICNIQPENSSIFENENQTFQASIWPDEISQHCIWEVRGFICDTANGFQNKLPFNCVPYIKFENLTNTNSFQPEIAVYIHSCISDYLVPAKIEGKRIYLAPIDAFSKNSAFKKRAVFENELINFLGSSELKYAVAGVNLELRNSKGERMLMERNEIVENHYCHSPIHAYPHEDKSYLYQKKVITVIYYTDPPTIKEIIVDE